MVLLIDTLKWISESREHEAGSHGRSFQDISQVEVCWDSEAILPPLLWADGGQFARLQHFCPSEWWADPSRALLFHVSALAARFSVVTLEKRILGQI